MAIDSIEERGRDKQEIIDFVNQSPEAIEHEFTKDYKGAEGNPWLACFGSRTFGLKGWIEIAHSRKVIPQEQMEEFDRKLQTVKDKASEVKKVHGWNPPDEIRQELLAALKSIIE